jgi:hypothetical protein
MNKQINLVINGKGGVGKSFFATNLVQYLKDGCIAHRAFDTDHENSTLKRFHAAAEFVSLEDRRGLDAIFHASETRSLLVIDCRAASTDLFLDYFAGLGLSEVLGLYDARLTLICPVNHEADSVEQVRLLSDSLGPQCRYVVVKTQAHSEAFTLYEGSKMRGQLVDKRGPKRRTVARLASFTWAREDFCRGWLITGDTGSGKSRSGITPLLFQVFTNEPTWGLPLYRRQRTLLGNALGDGKALRPRRRRLT